MSAPARWRETADRSRRPRRRHGPLALPVVSGVRRRLGSTGAAPRLDPVGEARRSRPVDRALRRSPTSAWLAMAIDSRSRPVDRALRKSPGRGDRRCGPGAEGPPEKRRSFEGKGSSSNCGRLDRTGAERPDEEFDSCLDRRGCGTGDGGPERPSTSANGRFSTARSRADGEPDRPGDERRPRPSARVRDPARPLPRPGSLPASVGRRCPPPILGPDPAHHRGHRRAPPGEPPGGPRGPPAGEPNPIGATARAIGVAAGERSGPVRSGGPGAATGGFRSANRRRPQRGGGAARTALRGTVRCRPTGSGRTERAGRCARDREETLVPPRPLSARRPPAGSRTAPGGLSSGSTAPRRPWPRPRFRCTGRRGAPRTTGPAPTVRVDGSAPPLAEAAVPVHRSARSAPNHGPGSDCR